MIVRSMWWMRVLCGMAALLGCIASARAEVRLPNGLVVPTPSTGGEVQLSTLFTQRGEAIDFVQDGFPTPDTFSPLCGFKATFVLKESSSSLGVGWYNVDPGGAAPTAVYPIVPAGTAVGTVVDGQNIRADANYAGGLIGFALIRNPNHYSEARWNTVCNQGTCASTPGPWILSISYRSQVLPNAYYLAFEDGDTSASTWSNDGDYNDYVFLFEGLACAGDGEVCQVPEAQGVCRDGIQECDNTGVLTCKPITAASDERCDGLDNDCNGQIDDGDLCDGRNVCSRGVCVPRCGTGEFICYEEPYLECEDGVCVEPACVGKTCAEGQICVAGECRGGCDGVTCPAGRTCRFGACVDPCAGVTCPEQRVCVDGACVLDCACAGCGTGASCEASGLCEITACVGKECAAGEYCGEGGACSDACAGAVCPSGSMCQTGECVASPPVAEPDAGTGDGSADGDADGAGDGDGDGTPDAGVDAGRGGGGGVGSGVETGDSGCSCRIAGAPHGGNGAAAWLLALGLLGVLRYRRRA